MRYNFLPLFRKCLQRCNSNQSNTPLSLFSASAPRFLARRVQRSRWHYEAGRRISGFRILQRHQPPRPCYPCMPLLSCFSWLYSLIMNQPSCRSCARLIRDLRIVRCTRPHREQTTSCTTSYRLGLFWRQNQFRGDLAQYTSSKSLCPNQRQIRVKSHCFIVVLFLMI